MLINIKMSTVLGILTFVSMIYVMQRRVEHEKSLITKGPGLSYHCAFNNQKLNSLFFSSNISCGFSKELSQ